MLGSMFLFRYTELSMSFRTVWKGRKTKQNRNVRMNSDRTQFMDKYTRYELRINSTIRMKISLNLFFIKIFNIWVKSIFLLFWLINSKRVSPYWLNSNSLVPLFYQIFIERIKRRYRMEFYYIHNIIRFWKTIELDEIDFCITIDEK